MTPALLHKTSRRSLSRRKASAVLLMVERSSRSRCRKMSTPLDSGTRDVISEMALAAFSSERAAT